MTANISEGPDVTELRAMLALASKARRWRVIIATVKGAALLAFFVGLGWLVYQFV